MYNDLDTTPASVISYIGWEILFCLPCVGFIAMIILACSARNVNIKNFATAHLILTVAGVILVFVIYFIFGAAILSNYNLKY